MSRLAFRGFNGKALVFEEFADIAELELDEALEALAEKHCAALASADLHMIEVEFLDEPRINQRFFRFGTDPAGMVVPIKIDLSPEGREVARKRIQEMFT